jgi:hypothetical protein
MSLVKLRVPSKVTGSKFTSFKTYPDNELCRPKLDMVTEKGRGDLYAVLRVRVTGRIFAYLEIVYSGCLFNYRKIQKFWATFFPS